MLTEQVTAMVDYGKHYTELYRTGWFNNPRVAKAFGIDFQLGAQERALQIKNKIYKAAGVQTLKELAPSKFLSLLASRGIAFTLPAGIKQAAGVDDEA